MELDNKGLGRLRHVTDPREVWLSESGDFTPWLAENIDVLADALGMSLTVIATEVIVGDFRLDIHAEDSDGRTVVIENQLQHTDHGHLGQCLVYASGLTAGTIVWVSPRFRDEFRLALDWLNERTDVEVDFFGVEVGVVQIGDTGPRAPVFDVVSRPNDWQKELKTTGEAAKAQSVSPLNAARQDFFAEVLTEVIAQRPAIRMPARGRDNWVSFASGPFGYWALSVAQDGSLRAEAYLDSGEKTRNKALFDELAAEQAGWETKLGFAASFERLDDKRASRIAAYHAFSLDDDASRAQALKWAVATLVQMFDVLNAHLRSRAKQLRDAAVAAGDKASTNAHDGGGSAPALTQSQGAATEVQPREAPTGPAAQDDFIERP